MTGEICGFFVWVRWSLDLIGRLEQIHCFLWHLLGYQRSSEPQNTFKILDLMFRDLQPDHQQQTIQLILYSHPNTATKPNQSKRQPQRTIPTRTHRRSRSPQRSSTSRGLGPIPPRTLAQKTRMRSHPIPASQTRNHPTRTHLLRRTGPSSRRRSVSHCRGRGIAIRGVIHHVQR